MRVRIASIPPYSFAVSPCFDSAKQGRGIAHESRRSRPRFMLEIEIDKRADVVEEIDNIYESSWESGVHPSEKSMLILSVEKKPSDLKHAALIVRTRELIKQNHQ